MRNSRTAKAGNRNWSKRRGEMGLHFIEVLGATPMASIYHAPREIARACHRLGFETTLDDNGQAPDGWPRTSVRHLVGQCKRPRCAVVWGCGPGSETNPVFSDGTAIVSFVVHDGHPGMSNECIAYFNKFVDLLCAPTQLGLDQFVAAGYTGAAAVVPLGVDMNLFHPRPRDWSLLEKANTFSRPKIAPGTFVFMATGYQQPRKGLDIALEAFLGEFSPDEPAVFVIKNVAQKWGVPADALAIPAAQRGRVALLQQELSSFAYARLIASVDCVVSSHRLEGFGMCPLEALASGTAVVSANCEGPATYLTPDCAYLVEPSGWEPWPQGEKGLGQQWATLDPGELGKAMRAAYEASDDERQPMLESGLRVARGFSWKNTADTLTREIQKHVGQLRRDAPRTQGKRGGNGLAVLVPCRNSQADLDRLIESFERTEWPGEKLVFVFDDASDPPLVAACHGDLLRSPCWVGEGAARDALLRRPDLPEFVFMTDADVEFTDLEWAVRLAEGLSENTIRHPLMLLPDGRVWSAGGCYFNAGSGNEPWLKLMDKPLPADGLASCEITHAPGAGWFGRSAELARVWDWPGGYFPTMFADTDMALWCRMHGMRFEFTPSAAVTHHHGSFTRKQTNQADLIARQDAHRAEFNRQWSEMVEDDVACAEGDG